MRHIAGDVVVGAAHDAAADVALRDGVGHLGLIEFDDVAECGAVQLGEASEAKRDARSEFGSAREGDEVGRGSEVGHGGQRVRGSDRIRADNAGLVLRQRGGSEQHCAGQDFADGVDLGGHPISS